MGNLGKARLCRRCHQKTWDYDALTDTWWCGVCDTEADL